MDSSGSGYQALYSSNAVINHMVPFWARNYYYITDYSDSGGCCSIVPAVQ